jgi:hypothetical protein
VLLLIAFVLAGWAFGALDSRIPMPSTQAVFWAGNLGSPWLVLPFLVGWAQRSRGWALTGGMLTCTASMVGFFGPGGGWGPASLAFVASWLLVGALAGGVYGLFGDAWGRSRALLDGLALAMPFILEPWAWSLGLGYVQGLVPYWSLETAVGVALLVCAIIASRRRRGQARAINRPLRAQTDSRGLPSTGVSRRSSLMGRPRLRRVLLRYGHAREPDQGVSMARNGYAGGASGGAVYGLGLIGALVYFIQSATSFWDGVYGVFQAVVWPAFLVYGALHSLKL